MNPDALRALVERRRSDYERAARIYRTTKGTRRPGLRIRQRSPK